MASFLPLQQAFQSLLTAVHSLKIARDGPTSLPLGELEQFRIFAHYLAVMKIVADPSEIPSELLKTPLLTSSLSSSTSEMSGLHERVVSGLSSALEEDEMSSLFEVRVERSSFGGIFPVDVAVIEKAVDGRERSVAKEGRKTSAKASLLGLPLNLKLSELSGTAAEDDVVALLEVDGPTHYRFDGQLRRKDLLKEAMYLAVEMNHLVFGTESY